MTIATDSDGFDFPELPLQSAPEGVSILLTGDDTDALERVFYHLITARKGERSLVLAPETSGRAINCALDGVVAGASTRSTVLTCEAPAERSTPDAVDESPALSSVGMQFSALVAESGTVAAPQRAGLILGSDTCRRVSDKQSISRFVYEKFFTHLRRSNIMGVCGIDTSDTVSPDITTVVENMATTLSVHLRVEATTEQMVTIHITGPDRTDEAVSVALPELTPPAESTPEASGLTPKGGVGD